jgi:hypothetical protein
VGAAFAVIAIVASAWYTVDSRPPAWDYATHLENAIRCRHDLFAGDPAAVFGRSAFYPPLVPCVAGLVYAAWPSDMVFGEIVMLAFLGLGMASTYVLARRFAGEGGGVVAAILFGAAPTVLSHALHFQLDVPLAAMVATFLVALLASEHFERVGWTIVSGILLGLGMLTKPPFLVFVAPTCLLVLAGTRRLRNWTAAAGAAVLAVLVALPWYAPRALGMSVQIQNRSFKQAEEAGFPSALSAGSLAYYPLTFPAQFGAIAVVLLLIGILVAVRRRHWHVLAGLAPFLVFLLLQNKQMRYVIPLLPMMAVAAGLGFSALPRGGRRLAAVIVVAVAAFQVSSTAFAIPAGVAALPMTPDPPRSEQWPQRAILELIERDSGGAPRTVSIVPNHPHFSPPTFRYYAAHDARRVRVARAWEGEPIGIEYMVLKTGDLGPPWTIDKARRVTERLSVDATLARAFPVIGEFPLPDGSTASVRVRRLAADVGVAPEALARSVEAGLRARLVEHARDVEGLEIRLDYDARILGGRIKRLEIAAAAATVGELRRQHSALLRLRNFLLVIDDVLVNPWSAATERRFDPLDAGGLTLARATIEAEDLRTFLARVKGVGRMSLSLGAGFVDLTFGALGPDVAARIHLVSAPDRPFALAAQHVTVGGVPVPSLLVNWIMNSVDPTRGLAHRLPFPATIRPVTVTPSAIRIGES